MPPIRLCSQAVLKVSLLLAMSACNVGPKAETCPAGTDGLLQSGLNGSTLADKELSLIFLKGPTEASIAIGRTLQHEGVSATFFVKGEEIAEFSDNMSSLRELGHVFGTGGYTFEGLKEVLDPVMELRAADALLTKFTVGNQFWLYGESHSLSANRRTLLQEAGFGKYIGPISEDTNGPDFKNSDVCWSNGLTPEECAANYLTEIHRIGHGIVAFYDKDERTNELLEILIPELKTEGYSFRRLDQIPDLRAALVKNGATPDATTANTSCDDYE